MWTECGAGIIELRIENVFAMAPVFDAIVDNQR